MTEPRNDQAAAKFGESVSGPGEASPIRQPDSPIQPSAAQDQGGVGHAAVSGSAEVALGEPERRPGISAATERRYRDALPLAADVFCEVAIATVRGHLISPSEIAENIGRGTPNSVNVTLHRLVQRGLIENKGHRRWVLR